MRRWGIATAHRAHNDTVLLLRVCPLKVCIWRFHHLLLLLGGIEFTTAQRSNLLHSTAVVVGLLGWFRSWGKQSILLLLWALLGHIRQQVRESEIFCQGERNCRHWELLGKGGSREEIVLKHLLKIHTLSRVKHEAVTYEGFGERVDLELFREGELPSLNLLISLLDFGWLKWGPAT